MGFHHATFLFIIFSLHRLASSSPCSGTNCNSTQDLNLTAESSQICLEKISNQSILNMVAHPDGSNRVFLADQTGKIWLASTPKQNSGELLQFDETKPFLDLTKWVKFKGELGLMGLAFHPNFTSNGRFFVSFNCDKTSWPECSGKCSCNGDTNCDPVNLPAENGAKACQHHSVVSEFTVNGTAPEPSSATNAVLREVRRVFTMGLPFSNHHGGQILFGPEDGYLYLMMGDGGSNGDPQNFAQNKRSLLGKIMRLDVDGNSKGGQWGNYSIPSDNPFANNKSYLPEIWAMGFRNPWRCSFDSERPQYFLCGDVGQDRYEEVDMVKKGGNYGWRVYEGPYLHNSSRSENAISAIGPVMGYNHSEVSTSQKSASITGGYFYRSPIDPCLEGRYLFADLFADAIWAGIESPDNKGSFSSLRMAVACAEDSPMACTDDSMMNISSGSLGYLFSFGIDNDKDMFILASGGVLRVVRPSRCKFKCSKEKDGQALLPPIPSVQQHSSANLKGASAKILFFIFVFAFVL